MAKVDLSQLGALLGVSEQLADIAVAELERQLGYPLCGSTEPEERIFPWNDTLWHRTHPMYGQPTSITLVRNGHEETVSDYQLGQNGQLFGSWFNAFKLCNICQAGRCSHCGDRCDYIKIVARWGFGAPEIVEESNEADCVLCILPDDLYGVLEAAIKEAQKGAKNDIQSENTGTRSYSKFTASYKTTWQKYAGVIDYYRMRMPRAY